MNALLARRCIPVKYQGECSRPIEPTMLNPKETNHFWGNIKSELKAKYVVAADSFIHL